MSKSMKQNEAASKDPLVALNSWMELQDVESLVAMSAAQHVEGFRNDRVKELGKKLLVTPEENKFTELEVALAFQVALSFLCLKLLNETDTLAELLHQKNGKEDA
jgi:hypothetical protein